MENLTEIFKIFLTALTPIGELRASIPLGLTVFHQPIWIVFIVSVIGNIIPPMFILWLFPKVSKWLMANSKLMNRFLTWLFERTRKKTKDKIDKYGNLALIIFVAIPLPNTGAWTGRGRRHHQGANTSSPASKSRRFPEILPEALIGHHTSR